jgi:hypothetical protein
MYLLSILLASMLAMSAGASAPQAASARRAVPIFDGKTLNGWEGDREIFRTQEGAIVGGSLQNPIKRNEFLCTTRSYADFELRLKAKLLGGESANAGVQFRTARIPNDREVSGYQADLGQGYWGSLYDESRRKKTLAAPDAAAIKAAVRIGDWNDYVIRAEGPRIRLWFNGVATVDYTERDATTTASGVVCVQIHAGPASEAWYKDITVLDLTK